MHLRPSTNRCGCPALDFAQQRHLESEQEIDGLRLNIEALTRAIMETSRRLEEAERQAQHDKLTGLANRRLLTVTLQRAIERAQQEGLPLAVLFIDLDGFKAVNDRHGHPFGDEVLKITAELILSCIRDDDTAFRYGGDEFVVILSDIAGTDAAMAVARDICRRISQRHTLTATECPVSASIGIALYPRDGESCDSLLRCADAAMYQRKPTSLPREGAAR